jgi:ABC-type glycerol-3-phosphate transport system substrate-binding protein
VAILNIGGVLEQYAPRADVDVTYIPVPEEGADSATWAGGWSVVIPAGTENVENAVRALTYMAGPEGQEVYSVESNHLPTLTELSDVFDSELNQFFVDLVPYSNSRPPLPVGVQYWDELSSAQEAVTLGQSEPEAALQNVQDRVNQRLERFCPLDMG